MTDIADSIEPVGNCPEHGPVYGDDLDFGFPAPATCDIEDCGREVEQVVMANVNGGVTTISGP